jgi:hypothetical protein
MGRALSVPRVPTCIARLSSRLIIFVEKRHSQLKHFI